MPLSQNLTQTQKDFTAFDYEKILIGAVIGGQIDVDHLFKIKSSYIYSNEVREIYNIIIKLYQDSGWADYVSILTEFSTMKGQQAAKVIIDDLIRLVPHEFNPQKAIEIIEQSYILRSSVDIMNDAIKMIQTNPYSAPELSYQAHEKIESLVQTKIDYDIVDDFNQTANAIVAGDQSQLVLKTGLKSWDECSGGLSLKEVTCIGARPGHGKTTTSIALALSILDENPDAVVVKFELEMDKESIKRKFISSKSGVSAYKIRLNTLSDTEKAKVLEGAKSMEKYQNRLFIYDNIYDLPSMNKILRATKANVAMVDFISLMDGVEEDKRNEIGRIVKYAKRFAKAHNMSYIFYSQLNRGPEIRENHRPLMSDLAESDQITQYSSDIVLLYYKYKYSLDEADRDKLWMIFDKVRYGEIGDKKVYFSPDLVTIKDLPKGKK